MRRQQVMPAIQTNNGNNTDKNPPLLERRSLAVSESRVRPIVERKDKNHASTSSDHVSRRRLPSLNRAISIFQLWCILNLCISIVDCIESTFGDNGGQHGQESEESKEGEKDNQEEKEVTFEKL
jgi:hypothetical protein